MTKQFIVKYRYKLSPDSKWLYDTTKTQAKNYTEAKNRVVDRLKRDLGAWEIEL